MRDDYIELEELVPIEEISLLSQFASQPLFMSWLFCFCETLHHLIQKGAAA